MPTNIDLTEQNDGQTIDIHLGQSLVVSLPENATTGYRWAIDHVDTAIVEVREGEPQYGSGAIGSGGRAQWVFAPKAPGTTSIALKRWRHWEGDRSIVERFRIELRVLQ